jgi:hypothetical protein
MRRCLILFFAVILLSNGIALAATKPIARNAKIFIEKMENDLDGYLRAEITKKSIPLEIVLKEEDADIVMTGQSSGDEKRKWHEGWLTAERDHATANVMIVERETGKFLWATEAGDRSIWWGAMKRGGQRQVANRIANNLKKAIQ